LRLHRSAGKVCACRRRLSRPPNRKFERPARSVHPVIADGTDASKLIGAGFTGRIRRDQPEKPFRCYCRRGLRLFKCGFRHGRSHLKRGRTRFRMHAAKAVDSDDAIWPMESRCRSTAGGAAGGFRRIPRKAPHGRGRYSIPRRLCGRRIWEPSFFIEARPDGSDPSIPAS